MRAAVVRHPPGGQQREAGGPLHRLDRLRREGPRHEHVRGARSHHRRPAARDDRDPSLAALAERLEELPEHEREPIDGFSPRKIRNRYLLNDDEEGERQYKLILSQATRPTLISIVQGLPHPATGRSAWSETSASSVPSSLTRALDLEAVCRGLDKLVVVDVTLTRNVDNPQLVFEAMNSTGRKLSQADLIRNYVLMDLPPKQQEKLYTAYWRPMELEFSSAGESQFDEFVRHYLTIKTGEIPRLDDIYDAFKAYTSTSRQRARPWRPSSTELREFARRYARWHSVRRWTQARTGVQGSRPDQGRRRLPIPARGLHRLRAPDHRS